MSYEGDIQALCQAGHLTVFDDMTITYGLEKMVCCEDGCTAPIVWENNVDHTNCEAYGEIDMKQFLISVDQNTHIETYRIPTPEETKAARTWKDWRDNKVKPIL